MTKALQSLSNNLKNPLKAQSQEIVVNHNGRAWTVMSPSSRHTCLHLSLALVNFIAIYYIWKLGHEAITTQNVTLKDFNPFFIVTGLVMISIPFLSPQKQGIISTHVL